MRVVKYALLLWILVFGWVYEFQVAISAATPFQKTDSEVEWIAKSYSGIPFWIAYQSEITVSPVEHRTLFLYLESRNFSPSNVSEVFKGLATELKLPMDLSMSIYSNRSVLKRAIDIYVSPPGCYGAENMARNLKKLEARYGLGNVKYREAVYYRNDHEEEFYCRLNPSKQETIKFVLKSRANQFVPSSDLNLDLVRAAKEGASAYVESLLTAGANINARDESGYTALMNAAGQGHVEIVNTLLAQGADVSTTDGGGGTALMRAALHGDIGIISRLLAKGADVSVRESTLGGTALSYSVPHPEVTRVLLDNGADPNVQDDVGLTALMIAAADGEMITTQLLLDKGADPNAKDRLGKTALAYAKERNYDALVELLKRVGAKH